MTFKYYMICDCEIEWNNRHIFYFSLSTRFSKCLNKGEKLKFMNPNFEIVSKV